MHFVTARFWTHYADFARLVDRLEPNAGLPRIGIPFTNSSGAEHSSNFVSGLDSLIISDRAVFKLTEPCCAVLL